MTILHRKYRQHRRLKFYAFHELLRTVYRRPDMLPYIVSDTKLTSEYVLSNFKNFLLMEL